MIHTAQINLRINHSEEQYFISLPETEWRTDFGVTYPINRRFSNEGIRSVWLKHYGATTYLSARINLNRLALGGAATVHPLPPSADALTEACKNLSDKLAYFVPQRSFAEWMLYRIDYTLDIKPGQVEQYIKLLQRGDKPTAYKVYRGFQEQIDCKIQKRTPKTTHFPDSCTYDCASLQLSFYNKQRERMNRNEPASVIAECEGILRFEMRCKKRKIRSIAELGGWESLVLEECQRGSVATAEQVRKYLLKCCRVGDYYTLAEARKVVEVSSWRKSRKIKAIQALERINLKRSNN